MATSSPRICSFPSTVSDASCEKKAGRREEGGPARSRQAGEKGHAGSNARQGCGRLKTPAALTRSLHVLAPPLPLVHDVFTSTLLSPCMWRGLGVIKIADFGISKMIQTSDGEKEKLLETAGTPAFMSPELCSGKPYDGNLADVYALGATMFMLRCGTPPFVANKLIVLYHKIQEDPVVFTTECASGFKNLILKMMEKVPEKRVSLDGVMKDKWLQSKPGEESGGPKVALSQADKKWRDEVAGSAEKVKLNSEDMMQSVHLAMGHAEKEQNGEGKAGVVNLAATMEETEMERRVRGFQKKGSIRQRSFETVDALVGKREEGKKEAIDSDDEDMFDFGDDDLEDEPISKLNSTTFNGMMDTLAHQTPPSVRKKQAPIPAGALTVGKVLDGLPNAAIGIRAAFYSEKGKRPNQEDTVTVIMDLSSLGDELSRPYLYQKVSPQHTHAPTHTHTHTHL